MIQVIKPENTMFSIIGKQNVNYEKKYRPFYFLKHKKVEGGELVLNTLTGELLFFEKAQLQLLNQVNNTATKENEQLIEKWFLVGEGFDDFSFCRQAERLINSINRIHTNSPITSFTILTTTDCNARCFYCYQHGCEHKTMNAKTAKETAQFIIESSRGNAVNLRWFGGEPLYNYKAIDIIVSNLKKKKINFTSTMTSNGYLFYEEIIKKAVSEWKLKRVQITIDGTEEIYNRVKAYIYKNETNAFFRVLNNIENLLKADVFVRVRTNLDTHNADDIIKLTDYLVERFERYDNFSAYVHLLFENSCNLVKKHSEFDRVNLLKLLNSTNQKLKKHFPFEINKPLILNYKNHCIADSDSTVLVLPDGKLSKCDHYLDSHYVGSVSTGITDLEQINYYKAIRTVTEKCDSCIYRMFCMSLSICPSTRNDCTDYQFVNYDKNIEDEMIRAFENFSSKEDSI